MPILERCSRRPAGDAIAGPCSDISVVRFAQRSGYNICGGTRVACGIFAAGTAAATAVVARVSRAVRPLPTLQFAVILTDRSTLNRSASQYERAFSVRFLLDHEMQTRRRANQGAKESGAIRGIRA